MGRYESLHSMVASPRFERPNSKPSLMPAGWSILLLPLPSGAGIAIDVGYAGRLSVVPRGNTDMYSSLTDSAAPLEFSLQLLRNSLPGRFTASSSPSRDFQVR